MFIGYLLLEGTELGVGGLRMTQTQAAISISLQSGRLIMSVPIQYRNSAIIGTADKGLWQFTKDRAHLQSGRCLKGS